MQRKSGTLSPLAIDTSDMSARSNGENGPESVVPVSVVKFVTLFFFAWLRKYFLFVEFLAVCLALL
jgi:hypothetical protein